jgi:hypothetical protein
LERLSRWRLSRGRGAVVGRGLKLLARCFVIGPVFDLQFLECFVHGPFSVPRALSIHRELIARMERHLLGVGVEKPKVTALTIRHLPVIAGNGVIASGLAERAVVGIQPHSRGRPLVGSILGIIGVLVADNSHESVAHSIDLAMLKVLFCFEDVVHGQDKGLYIVEEGWAVFVGVVDHPNVLWGACHIPSCDAALLLRLEKAVDVLLEGVRGFVVAVEEDKIVLGSSLWVGRIGRWKEVPGSACRVVLRDASDDCHVCSRPQGAIHDRGCEKLLKRGAGVSLHNRGLLELEVLLKLFWSVALGGLLESPPCVGEEEIVLRLAVGLLPRQDASSVDDANEANHTIERVGTKARLVGLGRPCGEEIVACLLSASPICYAVSEIVHCRARLLSSLCGVEEMPGVCCFWGCGLVWLARLVDPQFHFQRFSTGNPIISRNMVLENDFQQLR